MAEVTGPSFDMTRDLAPEITMTVGITGMGKWRARVWLAARLITLAAWIMNVGIKVVDNESQ